ncbi:MAG: isocitrate lyase/PEP mutase family protein [Candidatus Korobacteraceae bacterium]|jgi:2-methylisocitrate lyase-like PEP mutase family enzyme
MKAAPTFRQLVNSGDILVLPGAHDCLSALLIQQAGFKGCFIGGFQTVGVRYGIPDIGLAGLRDISEAVADILAVSSLPFLVDIDNGYGDVKNTVYTMHTYERLGVQAVFIEDQVAPKRCGHMAGKSVIPAAEMEAKLRAAAGERLNPDTFIIARTDARAIHGMDEALRRGERYLKAGADGLFIESPETIEELGVIARAFDAPQLANMLEGGRTPILKPVELQQLGFKMVIYGITLLMRITRVMQQALADLKSGELALFGTGVGWEEYKRIVGFDRWSAIEGKYPVKAD